MYTNMSMINDYIKHVYRNYLKNNLFWDIRFRMNGVIKKCLLLLSVCIIQFEKNIIQTQYHSTIILYSSKYPIKEKKSMNWCGLVFSELPNEFHETDSCIICRNVYTICTLYVPITHSFNQNMFYFMYQYNSTTRIFFMDHLEGLITVIVGRRVLKLGKHWLITAVKLDLVNLAFVFDMMVNPNVKLSIHRASRRAIQSDAIQIIFPHLKPYLMSALVDNIKSIRSIEISSAFTQLSQKTDQNLRTVLVGIPLPYVSPNQITQQQSGEAPVGTIYYILAGPPPLLRCAGVWTVW
ncbi:hypothetical protein AGLY_001887 [Aphis glycines]|uniref:Uncharacterized protein n=1 Tax=Aphis glycines TaxID=307491 RepID=A0A6G0U5L1_APHGL|nr:hypothetical protein AGLY_001887 [Aphis glycines]